MTGTNAALLLLEATKVAPHPANARVVRGPRWVAHLPHPCIAPDRVAVVIDEGHGAAQCYRRHALLKELETLLLVHWLDRHNAEAEDLYRAALLRIRTYDITPTP